MMQIVKQTKEEKVAMYMKYTKKQLAEMLATRDIIEEEVQLIYKPKKETR